MVNPLRGSCFAPLSVMVLAILALPSAQGRDRNSPGREVSRQRAKALHAEGTREFDRGSLAKAEALFRDALAKDGELERARFHLATVLHLAGRSEAALEELARIRTEKDVLRQVFQLRGEVLLKLGRFAEALGAWQAMTAENVELRAIRFQGLARSLEGLARSAEAADAWTGYLELQARPGSFVLRQVALNRVRAGERERALIFCGGSPSLAGQASLRALCRAHVFHAAYEIGRSPEDRRRTLESLQEARRGDERNLEPVELLEKWKSES